MTFVTGDAGRGKTALIREFARRAAVGKPDLLVAAGNCNPYSGVADPYLPLRSILRMLMGDVELAHSIGMIGQVNAHNLSQAAPKAIKALITNGSYLVDTFIPGDELLSQAETMRIDLSELERFVELAANKPYSLAQQQLFEQYCAVLRALSKDHPLLLLLDDLQWADEASIGLLYHLSTRLEGARILVLCAYRPEEVALGRGGKRHPLSKALVEIKRQYGDVWLDLTRSDEVGGRSLIDALVDSEPNRLSLDFREQLFKHTCGHALFTIELLRTMQERGDLVKDMDGCWVDRPLMTWESLPSRVEAVIEERIDRLDEGLRQTLLIASVQGEDFIAQVVARVKLIDERKMLDELSLELEERHQLVRELSETQISRQTLSNYRFIHVMHQDYLYHCLGEAQRRSLHRSTAQTLEDLYTESKAQIAPQLAHHWQQAKDIVKARHYLLLAGQAAMASFAHTIAESYFRQALELNPDDMQHAALLAGLGEALRMQARREEAADVLRQAINLYRQMNDFEKVAILYRGLSAALWNLNYQDAWNVSKEGLSVLAGAPDSQGLAFMLAEAARTATFMHDARAEGLCMRALDIAHRFGSPLAEAEARITLALITSWFKGNDQEAIRILEEVIPFCEANQLLHCAARAYHNIGVISRQIYADAQFSYRYAHNAARLSLLSDDQNLILFSLDSLMICSIILGNLTSPWSIPADLPNRSITRDEENIVVDYNSPLLMLYKGEWTKAVELHRAYLIKQRARKKGQTISATNRGLMTAIMESYLFTGWGDLSEAEDALLENRRLLDKVSGQAKETTALIILYSIQNRLSDARALLPELDKAPVKLQLEAKTRLAMAEKIWDQALSAALPLIRILQSIYHRWEWARFLIDLGDIYVGRGQPGDLDLAREAYQQSYDLFSEMGSDGYVRVLCQRLHFIPAL